MLAPRLAPKLALALVLGACTAAPSPPSGGRPATPGPDPIVVTVIATRNDPVDAPHLVGLEAAELVHVEGRPVEIRVLDDRGDAALAADLLTEARADPGPAAILVVGSAATVAEQRTAIQADGRPVFVLGGDLYSARSLFRQAFQTAIPLVWQGRALARYLARDRGYRDVLVAYERDRQADRDAVLTALREEGLAAVDVPFDPASPSFPDAQAILHVGSPEGASAIGAALSGVQDAPQLAVLNESLRADLDLPPGTVAPGPYTWAGWATAIPRVEELRHLILGMGRSRYVGEELLRYERVHVVADVVGQEQEGHDAINVLMDALERTKGRTGEPLIRALERNRPQGPIYASLPVVLGPDDHTFADETWVGLFAVPAPDEQREVSTTLWRPIIRTFTYDGERTVFDERDRPVFFPFWKPDRPSPYYFRSTLGIVTGPDDPLH